MVTRGGRQSFSVSPATSRYSPVRSEPAVSAGRAGGTASYSPHSRSSPLSIFSVSFCFHSLHICCRRSSDPLRVWELLHRSYTNFMRYHSNVSILSSADPWRSIFRPRILGTVRSAIFPLQIMCMWGSSISVYCMYWRSIYEGDLVYFVCVPRR